MHTFRYFLPFDCIQYNHNYTEPCSNGIYKFISISAISSSCQCIGICEIQSKSNIHGMLFDVSSHCVANYSFPWSALSATSFFVYATEMNRRQIVLWIWHEPSETKFQISPSRRSSYFIYFDHRKWSMAIRKAYKLNVTNEIWYFH